MREIAVEISKYLSSRDESVCFHAVDRNVVHLLNGRVLNERYVSTNGRLLSAPIMITNR